MTVWCAGTENKIIHVKNTDSRAPAAHKNLFRSSTWKMALMHTIIPKAVNNHHNHVLSDPEAKSVECLTIKVHLAKDKPNPASAPYLKYEKKFLMSLLLFLSCFSGHFWSAYLVLLLLAVKGVGEEPQNRTSNVQNRYSKIKKRHKKTDW